MLSMAGKVAIVTGAGSVGPGWGNGKATATLLARQGAALFLVDINEAAAQETRGIIEGEGGTCAVHCCDMMVAADVREMVQAALPALMYLTPIIYPLAVVPERYRLPIKLNPLVYIVEIVRDPIYYGILPSPTTLLLAVVLAFGALAIGWTIFRHLAPRFHAHL